MEREIIDKACAGDMDAFEAIYREHSGMVYGVALRMTGNTEDAEEVAQDVFVAAHRSLRNFKGESSLKTWLYRIAVNMSLNVIRRRRGVRAYELPMQDGIDFEDPRRDVALKIEAEANERKIGEMLGLLNPDQRACLVLRACEGLSYEDIARTLGVNINTVRTRLKRARETLIKARAASEVTDGLP
jgi:RNA polymerase sigma-70 factor (ECF subfamily)